MRIRPLLWLLCLVLGGLAGCDRPADGSFVAETDEANFRRGRELLRQGRDQEALAAFLRVIAKRGDDAPESHLEVGLLYQQQIKDPIAAIYHYKKFRELKPNSPQSDLVRQRIDAATREFARTLPAQPLENQLMRNDMLEVVERLQRENAELKEQLASARTQVASLNGQIRGAVGDLTAEAAPAMSARPPAGTAGNGGNGGAPLITRAPIGLEERAPADNRAATQPTTQPTVRSPVNDPRALAPPTRPLDPTASAVGGRRHVVVKGDTLFNLAQRYYGDRARWRDIYAANRARMRSENDLQIGMELVVP